jgi:hypothetical protein
VVPKRPLTSASKPCGTPRENHPRAKLPLPELYLGFPKPVKIAVLPGREPIAASLEFGLGSLSRVEVLAVDLPVGNQFDPLDIMLFLHWMRHVADFYLPDPFLIFFKFIRQFK